MSPVTSTLAAMSSPLAEVIQINLPESSAQRLKALGIFVGQHVTLCKPGSPLIVAAAGGRVAVAGELAQQILVKSISHSAG